MPQSPSTPTNTATQAQPTTPRIRRIQLSYSPTPSSPDSVSTFSTLPPPPYSTPEAGNRFHPILISSESEDIYDPTVSASSSDYSDYSNAYLNSIPMGHPLIHEIKALRSDIRLLIHDNHNMQQQIQQNTRVMNLFMGTFIQNNTEIIEQLTTTINNQQ
jgi:tRNA/tmRNA/rRNA uracil-C5-methylase (TrmA/RlmC/RlmD family)